MDKRRFGRIGVYGTKTRQMQKRLTREAYGLTFKSADIYLYLGDRNRDEPSIFDLGNSTFFEVPDRAYTQTPVKLPVGFEPFPDFKADFSRFDVIDPLGNETIFRFYTGDFECLVRPLIVGDVFEIPFLKSSSGKRSFWQINDVDHKTDAEKFVTIVHAEPLEDSRRTVDIPLNDPTAPIMDDFRDQFDEDAEQQVPAEGLHEDPPEPEEVDYRDKKQSGFLDDPDFKI